MKIIKNNYLRHKLIRPIAFLLIALLLAGCAAMQGIRWRRAKSVSTITAYHDFIEKYPDGEHADQARLMIDKLNFENAEAENTLVAYNRYLEQFPNGEYTKQAFTKIEILHFKEAEANNTISAYKDYIEHYPEGERAEYARSKIEELYFEKAKAENTIAAYEEFLENYPDRFEYGNQLYLILEKLYFERAEKLNTLSGYEEYIKIFPYGKLSDQASSRIKELKIIAFRSLKNVRIIVDQTYNSGEIKSIKLPYENTASKVLRYAGIKTNITYDNTYSGTLTIKAEGHSRSSDYTGSISGKQYSGASVSGNFSFEIQNNFIYERSFNGSVSPPLFIQSKYQSPASAPFSAAFAKSNFTLELLRIIRDVFGPDPLIMALKNKDPDIQWKASWALGEIKDPRAVMPLISALGSYWDNEISCKAAELLGEMNDTRVIKPLIKALILNRDQRNIFDEASKSLIKIGPPAVEHLINELKNGDPFARRAVAEVLGEIKDPRAIGPLISVLADKDSVVRKVSAEALKKITSENFETDHEKWQDWWEKNKNMD